MADTDVKVALTAEDRTQDAFRSLNASIKALEANFVGLAAAAGAFAGGAFVTALTVSIKAAEDAAIAQRKLDAVIRATGNTTGYTAEQLSKLSESLARATSFDTGSFREATATFIRFGNVGGENLERVLRLSADYAALTGSTLPAAASKLASALNSPADGLRKLERGFGDLGPEVEAAVRKLDAMGDRAGAIALLIEALEKKIGGADAGINTGLTGATKRLTKALGDLAENIGGKVSGNGAIPNWFADQVNGINKALDATPMEKLILLASLVLGGARAGSNFLTGLANRPQPRVVPNSVPDLGGQVAAMTATFTEEEARRSMELVRETLRESKRLQDEFAREQERLRQLGIRSAETALQAEHDALNEAMKRDSDVRRAAMRERQQLELAAAKFSNDQVQKEIEAMDRRDAAVEKGIEALRLRVQQMELENSLMGLSNAERAKAVALLQLEALGISKTADGVEELVNRYRDAVTAQEQMRNQVAVWEEISSAAGRFFSDIVFNGRSAFDNLKRALKSFAAELVALFAKRWVLQMVASVTGSSSLAALAGQVGQGSLGGSLLNAGLGASGIGLGTLGEFAAGATGTFMGPTAAGSAAALGSQFAAFMTNPATLAVLAAVVIAVAVMSRRGGPKEGGSFFGTFDAQGNRTGEGPVPGFGRFYTPSGSDQTARDIGDAMGSSFATALRRFGGTSAGVGFGIGFDRDPRGTAPSRVSTLVTDATGRVVYQNINREAGRSEEDLQAALKEEAGRALLAALQASDLPAAIAEILSALDPYTASADQIDAALAAAERIAKIIDALAELKIPGIDIDVLTQFQRDGEQLEQTFARVGGLWSRYVDLFTTDAERLQQAQDLVTSTFEDLGVAVPDSMQAFKDLVAGLDLTTEAGRTMWERLMEIAPAFVAVQDAAARAAEAQREATRQMLEGAGISAEALTQIIRDGLLGRISEEEVGARMADIVVGGIYNALVNTYAQQITQIMLDGIITPMVTAATTGAAISAAASQASIDAMVAQVSALTELLAALFNDPAFKEAMDRLREAITSVAGSIGATGGYVPPGYVGGGAGGGAPDNSTDRILNERLSLERRLLELQGNTVEIRRRELEALDPSNRALQEHIWRLEDEAKAAAKAAELLRQRGDLEIRIMELTGNSAGALAARRQLELTAADESLRPLLLRIYALEDEARAADEAAESMREIVSNIDALKEASDGVRQSISQLRETLPGFNVVGARQQDVRDAYGAFSTITDSTPVAERIRRAQAYQQALLASHSAQMAQLEERAQAERRAYEADLAARREAADAANQLTLAFRELGDFAKSILVGDQSPLSATERLAELQRQYAAALAGASAGNLDAINELPTLASARLQSARQNAATLVDYQRQALSVQRDLAALGERGNRDLVEVVDGGFTISAGLQQEMNKLTQETIDSLKAIDDVLQGWIEEQQAALEDQAGVFASMNAGIVELVLNTRGLDQRIADAIGRARQPASGQLQTPAGVPASRTRPSADTPASADDVRAMREELNAALIAVAQNTSKTARLLQRWEGDGLPDTRVVA